MTKYDITQIIVSDDERLAIVLTQPEISKIQIQLFDIENVEQSQTVILAFLIKGQEIIRA
jgi:hypothetical protein